MPHQAWLPPLKKLHEALQIALAAVPGVRVRPFMSESSGTADVQALLNNGEHALLVSLDIRPGTHNSVKLHAYVTSTISVHFTDPSFQTRLALLNAVNAVLNQEVALLQAEYPHI